MSNRWNRPEKHIWKLVCGLPDARAREKRLLMLRVYIDDSGKRDQSPNQVLAGYLATAEQWAQFSNEWQQVLTQFDIDAFRMADAWRLSRKFKAAGALSRDSLIVQLVDCIKRNVEYAFVSSLPYALYDEVVPPDRQSQHQCLRPYFFGFYTVLSEVYQVAFHRHYNERVEVIFDEQGGEPQKMILSLMDHYRSFCTEDWCDLVVPTPTFQNDKDALPLQAADALAWLVRRDAFNASRKKERSHLPETLILGEALSMEGFVRIWDRESLARYDRILADAVQEIMATGSPIGRRVLGA